MEEMEGEVGEPYEGENGAHLRSKAVIHNIWPLHTPNRKCLNMCSRKREKPLCILCGRKEMENIRGMLYHMFAPILLPVSRSSPCSIYFLTFSHSYFTPISRKGLKFVARPIEVCLLWFCVVHMFDWVVESKVVI